MAKKWLEICSVLLIIKEFLRTLSFYHLGYLSNLFIHIRLAKIECLTKTQYWKECMELDTYASLMWNKWPYWLCMTIWWFIDSIHALWCVNELECKMSTLFYNVCISKNLGLGDNVTKHNGVCSLEYIKLNRTQGSVESKRPFYYLIQVRRQGNSSWSTLSPPGLYKKFLFSA